MEGEARECKVSSGSPLRLNLGMGECLEWLKFDFCVIKTVLVSSVCKILYHILGIRSAKIKPQSYVPRGARCIIPE